MSNIFYSEVDVNLQEELRQRGLSAVSRGTRDLDFMLGKIANVEIVAFKSGSSNDAEIVENEYGILGGQYVREGRYLASGKNGYLNETPYTLSNIAFDAAGRAYTKHDTFTDKTQRMPPYITSVDVTIGDHSMGLLNKSTIRIAVPNPQRDLDGIEEVWMRPGRYMKLYISHPDSAILSRQTTNGKETNGLLSKLTIPNRDVLLELYPHWRDKLDELENNIRKMNEYTFEGLITSFDLQYQPNGQVDVTISITGTSNVYTDVSMWMKSETKKEKETQKTQIDPATGKPVVTIDAAVATDVDPSFSFYKTLYERVTTLILQYYGSPLNIGAESGVVNFVGNNNPSTIEDRYIVFGYPFPASEIPDVDIPPAPGFENTASTFITDLNKKQDLAKQQKQTRDSFIKADSLYNRYITLGALIYFINEYIVSKLVTSVSNPMIMCDIEFSCSTYYKQLVSCIPDDILLLPKITDSPDGMNCYGGGSTKETKNVLWYYKNIGATGIWPGVHTMSQAVDSNKIYASRILINLETIQRILNGADGNGGLTAGGKKSFQLKTFLAMISGRIEYATGGAIKLKLMSHPLDETKMLFIDSKYLKTPLVGEPATNTAVTPFAVPMTIGSEYGSIVHEFNMTAKLPENAKNLAYVLNEGDVASEEDIAPFLNFMYNSKDPESVNRAIATYKQKHQDFLNKLIETGELFASAPYSVERQQSLYQALSKHIKFPSDDVLKAQQMIAPIFPFTVDFTIDGISGFRYGDVLEFKMLPLKYQINTVFSIIGITHTISTSGQWTTNIKCIMRPAIK